MLEWEKSRPAPEMTQSEPTFVGLIAIMRWWLIVWLPVLYISLMFMGHSTVGEKFSKIVENVGTLNSSKEFSNYRTLNSG